MFTIITKGGVVENYYIIGSFGVKCGFNGKPKLCDFTLSE